MMKAKVIKRVLASLLLVATMATVSGSVIAAPPNPKEYAQKIFEQVDKDWFNSRKTEEAKKVWQQKYSKDNVKKIVDDLSECASTPEARKEVACAVCCMIRCKVLDCLDANEIITTIKTLFVCSENQNASYWAELAISDIIKEDFMKKLSSDQVFQIVNISQKYKRVSWIVRLMAEQGLFKNFNKEQILNLLDIVKKEPADFMSIDVVNCLARENLLSELPPEQIFDLIKTFFDIVYNDGYGSDLVSFAQTICLMAQKHILKGLNPEQVSEIIKAFHVCARHTISDEIEAEKKAHGGSVSNMSYLTSESSGFSRGDAARSAVQESIGFMIDDGLFDGFEKDQIKYVLSVLKSCSKCEVYGAKSNSEIKDNIQRMAKRGLV